MGVLGRVAVALEKANELAEMDARARNRVDISLEEYEAMKLEITELTAERNRLRDLLSLILTKTDIPFDQIRINPESIETYQMTGPMDLARDEVAYRIEFTAKVAR